MASGKIKTADTVVCALFAAIICVISPWSLPISGEVPISLATAAIYLASACAGWKRGTVSVLLYIVIGALGVPVFSSFRGGLSVIAGPTGGYIIGYLPCAFICGFIIDRIGNGKKAAAYPAGMIAGTVILYEKSAHPLACRMRSSLPSGRCREDRRRIASRIRTEKKGHLRAAVRRARANQHENHGDLPAICGADHFFLDYSRLL